MSKQTIRQTPKTIMTQDTKQDAWTNESIAEWLEWYSQCIREGKIDVVRFWAHQNPDHPQATRHFEFEYRSIYEEQR